MKNFTLLHVPHSSTEIPEKYLHSFEKEKLCREKEVMTDWFCDELFDCGRDRLVFPVSRLVCDVERFRSDGDEIMSRVGMGAVYTNASDLSVLRSVTETEKEEILSEYYDVHHAFFADTVKKKLKRHGKCLIIDCHSFHPAPLPYELCQNEERPDFCVGTSSFHTPDALREEVVGTLEKHGYTVAVDSPFAGTIVPMEYYEKDRRVVSVMIEVNRKLYMSSPGVKNGDFEKIRRVIKECVTRAEKAVEY